MKMNLNRSKSPLLALTLFALPALALHCAPESWRAALLFNRDAIADGEWWRLWTGHWVHFGAAHLLWNVATIFGCAASLSGSSWRRGYQPRGFESALTVTRGANSPASNENSNGSVFALLLMVGLLAAPLLGLALYYLEPAMRIYGGLSGLVCGLVTLVALNGLVNADTRLARICWAALLVVIAVKSIGDLCFASYGVVRFATDSGVRVSAWAHAAGALLGAGFFLSRRWRDSCPVTSAGVPAS